MAVGRIWNGTIRTGQRITVVREEADDTGRHRRAGPDGHAAGHGDRRSRPPTASSGSTSRRPARATSSRWPGLPGGHDRRHAHRPRRPAAAAAPRRRRADAADDVRRQHVAARRARGQVRDEPPDQGPPRPRDARQRLDRGPPDRVRRHVRGPRPGRAPAGGPDRADAPRGLRAHGLAAGGAPPRGRRRGPGAVRADHGRHPARVHRRGPGGARRPARAASSRCRPTPTGASGWSSSCRSGA